jgi:hypothetical protein
MMIIRKRQMDRLKEYSLNQFENRMIDHLQHFFPDQYDALGESKTREMVRYGCKKASHYGFRTEHDVALYNTLVYAFGLDFDTDPKLPWAASVLGDAAIGEPSDRIERLYKAAIDNEAYAEESAHASRRS